MKTKLVIIFAFILASVNASIALCFHCKTGAILLGFIINASFIYLLIKSLRDLELRTLQCGTINYRIKPIQYILEMLLIFLATAFSFAIPYLGNKN